MYTYMLGANVFPVINIKFRNAIESPLAPSSALLYHAIIALVVVPHIVSPPTSPPTSSSASWSSSSAGHLSEPYSFYSSSLL